MQNHNLTIGVLALQGDFFEHQQALKKIGVKSVAARLPKDLDDLDGLIIPGGESTVLARLLDAFSLRKPLQEKIRSGLPVWGTCAGLIMLAKKLNKNNPIPLGVLNITVARNAFGRQINSFEADVLLSILNDNPIHAVFIRAPVITAVGRGVTVLGRLPNKTIVAVQQANMLGTSFHSELTNDIRLHQYFKTRAQAYHAAHCLKLKISVE